LTPNVAIKLSERECCFQSGHARTDDQYLEPAVGMARVCAGVVSHEAVLSRFRALGETDG
jgi:hypothetical protein